MTTPSFAEWLADPNAPPVTKDDAGGVLDWVGQAYGEQGLLRLIDAIVEYHGEAWVSLEMKATKNESIDGPWLITDAWGSSSFMNPLHVSISFKTTDVYL